MNKLKTKEEDKIWYVYMHINKNNNKKYIGLTKDINARWKNNGSAYLRTNKDGSYKHPAFAYALKKYSDWNNDWEHQIIASNLTKYEAEQLEIKMIALYKTNCYKYRDPTYGYNMTDGGEGNSGRTLSKETRQKIRIARIGKKASEETRKKLSVAHKGRKVSEETRKKISISKLGEKNYWYGKNIPEETKKKLSIALSGDKNPMYGKQRSKEIIDKMQAGRRKKWEDEAFREELSKKYSQMYTGKNNPKAHPVVQLTKDNLFIRHWDYILEASSYIGVSESCIRACCTGKQQSSGGYKWMYKEKYEQWIKENSDL